MRLVTAAKRFTHLVHLSFKKREWCPLINGDDFIKHVTYKNCFYLHYSLRWACDLGNSVIPAPRYHTNGALQAMATRNVCISLKT